ncbi:uncharacterized protein LOC143288197 [Babylonia areolata]|uniref:uncharacterized protein LOC143288197 n=1 Tax=Babylonia areolata TaxID=304850 RepID=UPI003FD63876
MMYLLVCIALAVLGTVTAQQHGNSGSLHGICHSNHMQMTEDQVIQNVVSAMNNNDTDGTVELDEVLVFFADLMGVQLGASADLLGNMTREELLQVAGGLKISKHEFTNAWHLKFHDSMEFIKATFDAFDANKDGFMDAQEIEAIIDMALNSSDANQDGDLQEQELVAFLERIYKNC